MLSTTKKYLPCLRSVLSSLLVISLAMFPVAPGAYANPPNAEQNAEKLLAAMKAEVDGQDNSTPPALPPAESLEPELLPDTLDWANSKETILPKLIDAAVRLDEFARQIRDAKSDDIYNDLIGSNSLMHRDPVLNIEAGYRVVDGQLCPRFLVNDEIYLLVPEEVSRDSAQLKKIIASTHIASGDNGRTITVVHFQSQQRRLADSTVSRLEIPKATSWKWYSQYWTHVKAAPTRSAFTMSLVVGFGVSAVTISAATAIKASALGHDFSWLPTIWGAGVFGIGVGTFIDFYQNVVVKTGNYVSRVIKGQAVTMAHTFGLTILMADGSFSEKMAMIDVTTHPGLMNVIGLSSVTLLKKITSVPWDDFSRVRDRTGESQGNVHFRIPFLGIDEEWKRSTFEAQMMRHIPSTLNLISTMLILFTPFLTIPQVGISVPVPMLLGMPIAMYGMVQYTDYLAKKYKDQPHLAMKVEELEKIAGIHKKKWDNTFGRIVNPVIRAAKSANKVYRSCANLLLRKKRVTENDGKKD
jgi:hypothetical protein